MESLLIFICLLLPFYFLTFIPIAHSQQQQDVLNFPSPPPPPTPPPPFSPPPPPWTAPPPPPPPGQHDTRHPPPPPRKQNHPPRRPPSPPVKSGMNFGEKTGLLFGGIIVILQFFVAGFLVVTRRRLFHGSNE